MKIHDDEYSCRNCFINTGTAALTLIIIMAFLTGLISLYYLSKDTELLIHILPPE